MTQSDETSFTEMFSYCCGFLFVLPFCFNKFTQSQGMDVIYVQLPVGFIWKNSTFS